MVLAETLGKSKISKDEIDEISKIFLDGKTSAKILHEQAEKYISWSQSSFKLRKWFIEVVKLS